MIDFLSPITQERQKPVAVSYEAESVRQHTKSSHFLFIKNSVFITEMYKQKLKQRFDLYNSIWQNETMFSSSISEITNNAAYRSIIGLGEDVIPFIIQDLKNNNSHWFYALEALTGQNPIKSEHRGIVELMKADWLEWANKNNQTNES